MALYVLIRCWEQFPEDFSPSTIRIRTRRVWNPNRRFPRPGYRKNGIAHACQLRRDRQLPQPFGRPISRPCQGRPPGGRSECGRVQRRIGRALHGSRPRAEDSDDPGAQPHCPRSSTAPMVSAASSHRAQARAQSCPPKRCNACRAPLGASARRPRHLHRPQAIHLRRQRLSPVPLFTRSAAGARAGPARLSAAFRLPISQRCTKTRITCPHASQSPPCLASGQLKGLHGNGVGSPPSRKQREKRTRGRPNHGHII